MIYDVYVAQCFEHVKGEYPEFDGVIFSFDEQALEDAITKDKLKNTEDCWWEYTAIVHLVCDEDTHQKIKNELKNNRCGWLFEDRDKGKGLNFYRKPDPKVYVPVAKNGSVVGYLKRK